MGPRGQLDCARGGSGLLRLQAGQAKLGRQAGKKEVGAPTGAASGRGHRLQGRPSHFNCHCQPDVDSTHRRCFAAGPSALLVADSSTIAGPPLLTPPLPPLLRCPCTPNPSPLPPPLHPWIPPSHQSTGTANLMGTAHTATAPLLPPLQGSAPSTAPAASR